MPRIIDTLDPREFLEDGLSHEQLIERITKVPTVGDSTICFSNLVESDYVLAHLGMQHRVVHRNIPYTNFEVKMNMALKGMQHFDFNGPILHTFSGTERVSRKWHMQSYLQGEYSWNTGRCVGMRNSRYTFTGTVIVGNSLAVHDHTINGTQQQDVLYAPVVRLDKFADFRRDFMFSGNINWPGTVTYWIHEDMRSKAGAERRNIMSFWLMWKKYFLPSLLESRFRVEYVSGEQLRTLFYKHQPARIQSLVQLRNDSRELLIETRNSVLALRKSEIMANLHRVDQDYLTPFLNSRREVEVPDAEAEPLWTDAPEEIEEDEPEYIEEEGEGDEDSEEAPIAIPLTIDEAVAANREQPVHQGILSQIEELAVPFTGAPITQEDIENVINQLAGIPASTPASHNVAQQAAEFSASEQELREAAYGFIRISPRRFGRTHQVQTGLTETERARILRDIAEREAQLSEVIAAVRRHESEGIRDFSDLVRQFGSNLVNQAVRIITERERLTREYPRTPEEAFIIDNPAIREIQTRLQHVTMQMTGGQANFNQRYALHQEYDQLVLRLNQLMAEAQERQRSLEEARINILARQQAEEYSQSDMAMAAAWAMIAQQQQQANNTPIGRLEYGTPGQESPEMLQALEEQFRNPTPEEVQESQQQADEASSIVALYRSGRIINEAIAAEAEEEDMYIAGIDPYDVIDPLELEARELEQTIEPQQHGNSTTSQNSSNQNPDVFGGDSTIGQEETEIF